jgi:hypothetical protein
MLPVVFLPFATLGAQPAEAKPNLDILRDAKVFAICQPGNTPEDVRALREMGVDVVVRGVHGAWHQSPDGARAGQQSKLPLMDLSHELGLCFATMITSAAIYPEDVPAGKYETWVTRDARNQMLPVGNWHQGCLSNPEYREYVKTMARAVSDGGADGIHYDESYAKYCWMNPLPGFCDHCCAQFRDYLRGKHDAQTLRARFGIDDIEGFLYRDYLAAKSLADKPWESPLHDDWWLFQLDATLRYEREIVDDSKAYARDKYARDLVTNANQYDITTLCAVLAGESAVYDHVNIGTGFGIEARADGALRHRTLLPPDASFVPMYRMARAATPDKKVCMFLDIQQAPDFFAALPPEQQDRLMEWLCAEAYASGCYHALHYRFSQWEGPREALQRCGRFFADNHDRYFAKAQAEARIGVLFSNASYVWDMYPTRWTLQGPAHCREYYGLCQALLDSNLQFGTVFLGDGRFLPEEKPAGLSNYDILIAPSAYALTDANLSALAGYVMAGGVLVRSGPFGTADENRQPRATLPMGLAVGDPRVYALRADYEAYIVTNDPETRVSLAQLLVGQLGHEPATASRDLAVNLQMHLRRATDRSALFLDILNRDYQPGRGFRAAGQTAVDLTLPSDFGLRGKTVRALSPDPNGPQGELTWTPLTIARRTPLREGMAGPMSIGGRHTIRITLPRTDVYTLVVIE